MSIQILAGIFLISLGLGGAFFAQRIFDYCVRTDSARTIQM